MGVRSINQELCNGCKTCINHCPTDVFRLNTKTKKAHIKYITHCQGCFLCEAECPRGAIYCVPVFEHGITRAW